MSRIGLYFFYLEVQEKKVLKDGRINAHLPPRVTVTTGVKNNLKQLMSNAGMFSHIFRNNWREWGLLNPLGSVLLIPYQSRTTSSRI